MEKINVTYNELVAYYEENPLVIFDLINRKINVNKKSKKGFTFLMYVVSRSSDLELIKALLDAGADVNAKNIFGRTPLMVSAKNRDAPDVIKLLIERGADINIVDDYGNTAFGYTKIYNRCKRCRVLLKKKIFKCKICSFDEI